MKRTILLFSACLTLFATPASARAKDAPAGGRARDAWTATWAGAQVPPSQLEFGAPNPSLPGFQDQTLRQVVRISVGGDRLRVKLSNLYGKQPLKVAGATLGRVAPGPTTASITTQGRARGLTFDGQGAVVIPAGEERLTDPLRLATHDLERLVVTMYLPEATGQATYHMMSQTTTFVASGNHLADKDTAAFPVKHASWFFLAGIEVPARPRRLLGGVVAFGDSITDGAFSTVDANKRYPDALAERLLAAGTWQPVLNTGLGGDRLLTDTCFGEAGTRRFARDVLDRPGVRSVVVLLGINDILAPTFSSIPEFAFCVPENPVVTAAQLIEGHRALIRDAHARGVKIIGATLTPYRGSGELFTAAGEAVRVALNDWIRTGGEFDAVADFSAAVADPTDPTKIRAAFDSGDGLHPNDAGLAAMAAAIDPTRL